MAVVVLVVVAVVCVSALLVLSVLGAGLLRPIRRAAVRAETVSAEARIDALTRQAIQQMRDVVRAELRERGGSRA